MAFLSKPSSADRQTVKQKKCKVKGCGKQFMPQSPFQVWCSVECGHALALAKLEKKRKAAAKVERKSDRAKRERMKTIPQLKAEVQVIFNQYVRLRDELAGHGCICCGKFPTAEALAKPGGAWDACHYRSRGSADHLRYDEHNVHRGLKDCNTWGHKDYRGGLVARIGADAVEALESNHTVIKWTREMLQELKATYRRKLNELKLGMG